MVWPVHLCHHNVKTGDCPYASALLVAHESKVTLPALLELFDAIVPVRVAATGATTATVVDATPLEAQPVEALLAIEALVAPNDEGR